MTAGSGILHIETPPAELVESGGLFHGVQLWVNLPKKDKFAPPRYQAIEGGDAALVASDDGGALIRIIAGEIDGHRGPGVTHTPVTLAHATVENGARLNIPGGATSTRSCTCCRAAGTSGRSPTRSTRGSWRSWAQATGSPSGRSELGIGATRPPLMSCF